MSSTENAHFGFKQLQNWITCKTNAQHIKNQSHMFTQKTKSKDTADKNKHKITCDYKGRVRVCGVTLTV